MKERAENKFVLLAISLVCLILSVLLSILAVSNINERLNPSAFVVPPSVNSIVTAVIGVIFSFAVSVMSALAAFSDKFYEKIVTKNPSTDVPQLGGVEIVAPELDDRLASGRIYITSKDRPLCWVIAFASGVVAFAIGYVCYTQLHDAQKGLYTSISPIFLILIIPFFIIFTLISIFCFIGALSQQFFDNYLKSYFEKQ